MDQDNCILASDVKLLEPMPREPRDLNDRKPAPPRILSTAPYHSDEQFDVWHTRISSMCEVGLPPGTSAADGFDVEYMTCNLAHVSLNAGHFAAQSFARTTEHVRRSPTDHWCLFYARSGEAWFETTDRQIHMKPGDVFLVSLDQDFRGRITDYDASLLGLPRDAFMGVAADLDRVCNTVLSGNLVGLLADYLHNLQTRVVGMNPDELLRAGRATAEMIAACIQPSRDRLEQAHGAIESVLFERARRYIRAHLGELDLTPEHVVQELRISRSNLYRAFEHAGGVAHYIQRTRLVAAHAELAAGNESRVQEVAHSHGFRLASDFARAFRREFGYSPREVRDRQRR
ncbi:MULTISPECIES: helix-turn-helix domain-containing protein [unclassified Bradyrhizobium]|uniref:helix-turn-helix domain-containing protein n=1 Tax=unclassified Bradyrhizobium TaxID=2631580 RepID=UPI001FF8885B|nr:MULTISPECIES: helix-turn-helix domain-containing protein [unclassified Bradyrhizobium]MCK1710685.1 helix-turn-helix domain-containing protein [Bradyrhizobium sp. 143]MCK1724364.1 helix-turn-helix domain-containing protein [Bradyrhizobium sp. 142]